MPKLKLFLAGFCVLLAVYLWNAAWRVGPVPGGIKLLSHRGVHQTFHRQGLKSDTCTAQRIEPPTHTYLENTLPSMAEAFAAGASVVELDIHPTRDGVFAVLHDWTLDCRTDGKGVTREQSLAYLKNLDIGHGYTADGGRSFPLRGRGKGLMPTLNEVFAAFPQGRFLINFKSNEAHEADLLAQLLRQQPEWRHLVWGAYGGDAPTFRAAQLLRSPQQVASARTDLRVWSRKGLMQCLGQYLALGWSGWVPPACRQSTIMVPLNVGPWLWGWPNLFLHRLKAVGTEVILLGPYAQGDPGTAGIDNLAQLKQVPADFSGYLWTNKIELIGPALKASHAQTKKGLYP